MTNYSIATDCSIKKDALKAKKNEGKEILLLDSELFIGGEKPEYAQVFLGIGVCIGFV